MPRDYRKEHDDLTYRYHKGGNPDKLTPAMFRLIHDKIWLDQELERSVIDETTYNERLAEVNKQCDEMAALNGN